VRRRPFHLGFRERETNRKLKGRWKNRCDDTIERKNSQVNEAGDEIYHNNLKQVRRWVDRAGAKV